MAYNRPCDRHSRSVVQRRAERSQSFYIEPQATFLWRLRTLALPTDLASTWLSRTGTPSRLFGTDSGDYELYEQGGEFVLSVEMPGFESDDIEVGWYEGRLTIAAERTDDRRDETRKIGRAHV